LPPPGTARPRLTASGSPGSPDGSQDIEIVSPGFEPGRQVSHFPQYPLGRSNKNPESADSGN
jgi:hypothetical protein